MLVAPNDKVLEVDSHGVAHEEAHPGIEAVVEGGVGAVRNNVRSLKEN